MNTVSFMLAKPADMLPLEFQILSTKGKFNFPVGQCLVECCDTAHNVEREILDACHGVEKLAKTEAIKKLKPQQNTREEYRGWELTLKY